MESSMESALKGHLLLTLVDHAKPFKGTWRIYRQGETIYSACHAPALSAPVLRVVRGGANARSMEFPPELCPLTPPLPHG
jgi:hypothetical protein